MEPRTDKRCEAPASKGKVLYFEWARCLGAASVVMIHVTSGIMDNHTIPEVGVIRALIWSEMQVALLRWAVPVFFMMTGALLLDPRKEVTWRRVWGYVRWMLLVLCTWGLSFCLMQRFFTERSFSLTLIAGSVLDLLSGKGFSHLWYIYALIGVYLLLPVLRAWVATAGDREQRTLLWVLFAFTCVVPTVNSAFGLELSTFLWLSSSVFYVFLGRYAHEKLDLDCKLLAIGIASVIACMALKAYGILAVGDYWKWLHGPSCPLEAVWSLCVFLLMKRWLDCQYRKGGAVERLATLSLGIYIVHPLFINFLYKAFGMGPWSLPPVIFESVCWTVSFLGSIMLASISKRTPLMRSFM